MAVYSMTGYANASASAVDSACGSIARSDARPAAKARPAASVAVEIRSVNGRFLDLAFRLPDELRGSSRRCATAHGALQARQDRAAPATRAASADGAWPQPHAEQLQPPGARSRRTVAELAAAMRAPLSVHEVAAVVPRRAPAASSLDEAALEAAEALRRAACAEARAREGERLAAVLLERVAHLRALADAGRAARARRRQRAAAALPRALAGGARRRPARRSRSRARRRRSAPSTKRPPTRSASTSPRSWRGCARTSTRSTRLLDKGGEIGKRLDFLIQELQREANTLGSKSAALELTNISVDMKVAIEQLREQVQNIE